MLSSPLDCVVLFDIDGTLVAGSNGTGPTAGVRAMDRACLAMAGKRTPFGGPNYAGRTDPQIARMLLEEAGVDRPSREIVRFFVEKYVEFLAEEIGNNPYRPLGAPRSVVSALRLAGARVALGTGNVRAGARLKLHSAGIDDLFDPQKGGYGEDGETRAEVLKRGALACDPRGELPVVAVGDTPRDISAAHEIGAFCIGVPFGKNDEATLREAGADATVRAVDQTIVSVIGQLSGGTRR